MKMQLPLALLLSSIYITSLTVWIIKRDQGYPISPLRWVICIIISLAVPAYGYYRKSLDSKGSILALVIGYTATLANGCYSAIIIAFFLSSSRLTKWRKHEKMKFEEETTTRNWKQVFCNGAVATTASLAYIITNGPGEVPLVVHSLHLPTVCSLACLGSISCCCGDTWASEVGSVLGLNPRLITSLRPVPRGTNGGVSLSGLMASTLGGLFIGLVYYFSQLMLATGYSNTPQWIVIVLGLAGGLIGSLIDSLLGATLQYSGFNPNNGKITHSPLTDNTKHISGIDILSNNSVNLISSILTALIIPLISVMIEYW